MVLCGDDDETRRTASLVLFVDNQIKKALAVANKFF